MDRVLFQLPFGFVIYFLFLELMTALFHLFSFIIIISIQKALLVDSIFSLQTETYILTISPPLTNPSLELADLLPRRLFCPLCLVCLHIMLESSMDSPTWITFCPCASKFCAFCLLFLPPCLGRCMYAFKKTPFETLVTAQVYVSLVLL